MIRLVSFPAHSIAREALGDSILKASPAGLANAAEDRTGSCQKSFGFSEKWADKILNQFSENSQSRYESAR
jgi:hypothetical protein